MQSVAYITKSNTTFILAVVAISVTKESKWKFCTIWLCKNALIATSPVRRCRVAVKEEREARE